MKFIKNKKTLLFLALVSIGGLGLFFNTFIVKAQVITDAPRFEIRIGDPNDVTPHHDQGDCDRREVSGWATNVSGSGDQDCIGIRYTFGTLADQYTSDFQVCMSLSGGGAYDQQCTPWASEGGGPFPRQINLSSGKFNSASVSVNVRSAPNGEYYTDADLSATLYYKGHNNGGCGGGGGSWARASTPTVWGWSLYNDNDPACMQAILQVQKHSPYNASFVRAEVTNGTQTGPNAFTVSTGTSYSANMVMHNTGTPWYSQMPGHLDSGDCSSWVPTIAGDTCSETKSYTSNDIVLSRTDVVPTAQIDHPAEIPYKQIVNYTYTAYEYPLDDEDPPPPPPNGCDTKHTDICPILLDQTYNSSQHTWWKSLVSKVLPKNWIPTAWAQTAGNGLAVGVSANQAPDIYSFQAETNFPFTVTSTATAGVYNLQYKMKRKSGAAPGTDAQGFFGSPANVTLTVGTQSGTLNCSGANIVTQGVVADFQVWGTGLASNDTMNVTMTSSPNASPNPTLSNSPVVLNNANSFTGIAHVATANVPPGTYTLTFVGTPSSGVPSNCPSSLQIKSALPTVGLLFDGSHSPTPPNKAYNYNGTLSWTSAHAKSCTATPASGTSWGNPSARLALSGSQQSGPMTINQTYNFTIRCVNSDGDAATDTVLVTVVNPTAPVIDFQCTGKNGIQSHGPCTVDRGTSGSYAWTSSSATACNINGTAVALNGSGMTGNLFAPKSYKLTCTGPGGTSAATVRFELTIDNRPKDVVTDNSTCGVIKVSWKPGEGTPPVKYNVYDRGAEADAWALDGSVNYVSGNTSYTYTDSAPLTGSNYYAVAAVSNTDVESAYVLADVTYKRSCDANTSRSDKDILRVDGKITQVFTPTACNGDHTDSATLPNNATFSPNDVITFRINICNNGAATLSGITITDHLYFLSNPTSFSMPAGDPNCLVGSPSYDAPSSVVTIHTTDVLAGHACSIIFKATVTAPTNPTKTLYRFQNVADVTSSAGPFQVSTGFGLFSLTGGVPTRNETAPH